MGGGSTVVVRDVLICHSECKCEQLVLSTVLQGGASSWKGLEAGRSLGMSLEGNAGTCQVPCNGIGRTHTALEGCVHFSDIEPWHNIP
jgi:hypothetical protein